MQFSWQKLPKPFFILAPMEDVTDSSFRRIVASCAAPDVFFTEFTNVDGMLSEKGAPHVTQRLYFTENERPLIAQIWGNNPESFYKAAKQLVERGFDGIDINMGCPVRKVINQETCSALIKNPILAAELIQATKEGAEKLPVSVKTRIGFNTIQTEEWTGHLLDQGIAALTVHGRTAKEESKFPAHWDEIGKVVKLRNEKKLNTVIIGNGDVRDRQHGEELAKTYELDGIMIGRGIFHNQWAFSKKPYESTIQERIQKLIKHTKLYEETWQGKRDFNMMKKFVKAYIQGFDNAGDVRSDLMMSQTSEELIEKLEKFLIELG